MQSPFWPSLKCSKTFDFRQGSATHNLAKIEFCKSGTSDRQKQYITEDSKYKVSGQKVPRPGLILFSLRIDNTSNAVKGLVAEMCTVKKRLLNGLCT